MGQPTNPPTCRVPNLIPPILLSLYSACSTLTLFSFSFLFSLPSFLLPPRFVTSALYYSFLSLLPALFSSFSAFLLLFSLLPFPHPSSSFPSPPSLPSRFLICGAGRPPPPPGPPSPSAPSRCGYSAPQKVCAPYWFYLGTSPASKNPRRWPVPSDSKPNANFFATGEVGRSLPEMGVRNVIAVAGRSMLSPVQNIKTKFFDRMLGRKVSACVGFMSRGTKNKTRSHSTTGTTSAVRQLVPLLNVWSSLQLSEQFGLIRYDQCFPLPAPRHPAPNGRSGFLGQPPGPQKTLRGVCRCSHLSDAQMNLSHRLMTAFGERLLK